MTTVDRSVYIAELVRQRDELADRCAKLEAAAALPVSGEIEKVIKRLEAYANARGNLTSNDARIAVAALCSHPQAPAEGHPVLCPNCGAKGKIESGAMTVRGTGLVCGDQPPRVVHHNDAEYRAQRRAEARETVARWRSIADRRTAAGMSDAARIWRIEADALELSCARQWGD